MLLRSLSIASLILSLALGAMPARAEQIYIYDRPNFLGEDYEATFDVPDLAGTSIAGKAASLRTREGVWLACSEANLRGNCLWIAHSQISDLGPWGFGGNIRSLHLYRVHGERFRWPRTLHVYGADRIHDSIIIAEDSYEGEYRKITESIPDLRAAGINFPVGAFIVTG